WSRQTSSEARNIVLGVIKSHDAPISTRDLFEKVVKVEAPPPSGEPLKPWERLRNVKYPPPHPDHPIRSVTYLKRIVLEELVRTQDVKKVHIKRVLSPAEIEQRMATMSKAQLKKTSVEALSQPVSTWLWQLVDKSKAPPRRAEEEESKGVFGAEVGVGDDWSHLNKRRRRAREEDVTRDARWM
ncbi:hypothetical protein BC826DRAFT_866315, partial [Russula brevipes]